MPRLAVRLGGKKSGERRGRTASPSGTYVPKNLFRRLHDDKSGGVNWSKESGDVLTPQPGAVAVHRPGSQNPRKG